MLIINSKLIKETIMSILEEVKEKSVTKYLKVKGSVTENFEKQLDVVCKHHGINQEEYIGKIIMNSEIEKEYKKISPSNNNQS